MIYKNITKPSIYLKPQQNNYKHDQNIINFLNFMKNTTPNHLFNKFAQKRIKINQTCKNKIAKQRKELYQDSILSKKRKIDQNKINDHEDIKKIFLQLDKKNKYFMANKRENSISLPQVDSFSMNNRKKRLLNKFNFFFSQSKTEKQKNSPNLEIIKLKQNIDQLYQLQQITISKSPKTIIKKIKKFYTQEKLPQQYLFIQPQNYRIPTLPNKYLSKQFNKKQKIISEKFANKNNYEAWEAEKTINQWNITINDIINQKSK